MLGDRLRERQAAFDVAAHRGDDGGERLRFGLLGEDTERTDQRQAGADHRRQLPREDHHGAKVDLASFADVGAQLRLAAGGDGNGHVAELAQLGDDELFTVALDAALVNGTGLVADLVGVGGAHRSPAAAGFMPSRLRRSSGLAARSRAVSTVIRLARTRSARFWSMVTIPYFAPACIWLAS